MQLGASHLRAKAHNAKRYKIDEFNCSMNNAEQEKRCMRRNVEDDDKDWTLRRLRPPKSDSETEGPTSTNSTAARDAETPLT